MDLLTQLLKRVLGLPPVRCYRRRVAVFSLLIAFTVIATILNYRYVFTNHLILLSRERKNLLIDFHENSACVLPKIDAFHEIMMTDINNEGPLTCKGQIYTKLEDGVLKSINHENQEAYTAVQELKEIRRVPFDDFEIRFSDLPVTTINQENDNNISELYEGFLGNIQHSSKKCLHPFGGEKFPKPYTRVVLHSDCGLKRNVFKLVRKHEGLLVKHVPSDLCLQPQIPDTRSKGLKELVLSPECEPSFKISTNGGLQDISSGKCIHAGESTQDTEENVGLVMKDECSDNETSLHGIHIAARDIRVNSEFIQVNIETEWGMYKEFHLQTPPKPDVTARPTKAEGMGLNVLMIMFDSTSAAQFQRKMPRSLEYLTNEVDSIFFKGEGIVGDGTTAQLSAMLTGIAEENQSEARRGKPGAKTIDDWNWIFKDFKNHGYATLFSEDDPEIATFNYRLLGFEHEPTDYYARPFWIAVDKIQEDNCAGSVAIHNISFDYIKTFCNTYPNRSKFALVVLSYLTHKSMNALGYVDEDLVRLLRNLDEKKHLNHSIVIIFGDHGYRFSRQRKSLQGKLEERLPFLSLTVPRWFPWKYPEAYRNLKHNSEILTSPFDIYATLRHVLSYPEQPSDIKTGQSLFNRIEAKNRTCEQAGIASHWCPCMQWEEMDSDQQISRDLANSVAEHINNLTSTVDLCHILKVKSILSVFKEMPNSQVQTFKETIKAENCDSCVPVFGRKTKDHFFNDGVYQLQIEVQPGDALFEASVRVAHGLPVVDTGFISRINAYGDQPNCVKRTHTHLVKYCYCR